MAPADDSFEAARPEALRIHGIDICRSLAILLAMWSHVLVTFGARWEGDSYAWLRFVMQMAPVTFICLFGAMLEIAYATKFRRGRIDEAIRRMLLRSAQCYLLYVISVAALLVSGAYSAGYSLRTILLIGITPYTDILKFYALALLVAPLLVSMRLRYGLVPLLFIFVGVQLAHPVLEPISYHAAATGKDYVGPILGFLYGGSNAGVGAPSFVHGMALVCLGMILGDATNAIFSSDRQRARSGWAWIIGLLLLSIAVSAHFWTDSSQVLKGIVSLEIRNHNHPFYYALGLSFTVGVMILCILLFDIVRVPTSPGLTFIGTTSLFTFCFGNVLLYLQPFGEARPDHWGATLLFAAVIPLQSWLFWRLTRPGAVDTSRAARLLRTVMDKANAAIGQGARPLADRYAAWLAPHRVDVAPVAV